MHIFSFLTKLSASRHSRNDLVGTQYFITRSNREETRVHGSDYISFDRCGLARLFLGNITRHASFADERLASTLLPSPAACMVVVVVVFEPPSSPHPTVLCAYRDISKEDTIAAKRVLAPPPPNAEEETALNFARVNIHTIRMAKVGDGEVTTEDHASSSSESYVAPPSGSSMGGSSAQGGSIKYGEGASRLTQHHSQSCSLGIGVRKGEGGKSSSSDGGRFCSVGDRMSEGPYGKDSNHEVS